MRTGSNLGATQLRKRRRTEDPMRAFDALPPPPCRWLAEAALPWSPASCRRIWRRARAEGASVEAILARLDSAQEKTLDRDGSTLLIPKPRGIFHPQDETASPASLLLQSQPGNRQDSLLAAPSSGAMAGR